jgi:HNH endonuclease
VLTQERLKEILHYDPSTGIFVWKARVANCIRIGAVAGCVNEDGYIDILIKRKHYVGHRLAFLYMTGAFPESVIDHIDRNPANNVWENLRPATFCQNGFNTKRWSNNTSGVKGVCWNFKVKKWQAHIQANGIRRYLGLFETLELAAEFRQLAAEMLHGEFVCHGD